jgi:hypothetical protein
MKKIILSFALILGCLTFASAQQNALGLKFNGGIHCTSLSYQRFLNNNNRLEFNLGFDGRGVPGNVSGSEWNQSRPNHLTVSGLYQWVWNVPDTRGFQWFVGTGASFGNVQNFDGSNPGLNMNVLANIGIEHNFNFPLQLAFDYTAGLGIGRDLSTYNFTFYSNTNHWEFGFRLAARWRF